MLLGNVTLRRQAFADIEIQQTNAKNYKKLQTSIKPSGHLIKYDETHGILG